MIVSLWGKEGCGKSSTGLSWPKPLFHLDLDLGGFDRAVWRLSLEAEKAGTPLRIHRCEPGEDVSKLDWKNLDIVSKPYLAPIQLDKILGIPQGAKGVSVRFPRQVVGVKELWQEIVIDIVTVGRSPQVKTVMTDSATQLWWLCHTGLLQEKQEIQISKGINPDHKDFREKLQPVEFPNDRMQDLIYSVRSLGKNMVMTHYPKDIYKERLGPNGIETYNSGDIEPDGFKHTVKLDDIVIWCYSDIDKRKEIVAGEPNPTYNMPQPFAKISIKCGLDGLGMSAVGLEISPPTYEGLMNLRAMMSGIA